MEVTVGPTLSRTAGKESLSSYMKMLWNRKHCRLIWDVSCSSLQSLVFATVLVLNVCAGWGWCAGCNAMHALSQWCHSKPWSSHCPCLNNCLLSERMEADGVSGSTCDREFNSLSRICCCLLFAYTQHGFILKGDYLIRSSWGILESLSLLLSVLGTLAGKKCGRQVLWLNTLVSQECRLRGA